MKGQHGVKNWGKQDNPPANLVNVRIEGKCLANTVDLRVLTTG
jgi:hypothetical protein